MTFRSGESYWYVISACWFFSRLPGNLGKRKIYAWMLSMSSFKISGSWSFTAGVTCAFYMLSTTHIFLEHSWARKGRDAREAELAWRVKKNIVDIVISFVWYATICLSSLFAVWKRETRVWLPSAMALTSFLCYTMIAGERLTVSKAFTSIALFGYLQSSMIALPGQVFAMLQGA